MPPSPVTVHVPGEGGILTYSEDPGERTHWKDGQTSIAAEVAFTKQDGRIARGTFKSARATEPFLAALGHDGKTIHFADTDGYTDGRVVDADTLEVVYRHSSAKSTVVAVTTWKRKK